MTTTANYPAGAAMENEGEMVWYIHQDRDEDDPDIDSYTITTNSKYGGWDTDSGYMGYGLNKELAQWICDRLNECGKNPPYAINRHGDWEKQE
jgi:hypothetical protein